MANMDTPPPRREGPLTFVGLGNYDDPLVTQLHALREEAAAQAKSDRRIARIWSALNYGLGFPAAALAAVAGATAFQENANKALSLAVGLISAILTGVLTTYTPSRHTEQRQQRVRQFEALIREIQGLAMAWQVQQVPTRERLRQVQHLQDRFGEATGVSGRSFSLPSERDAGQQSMPTGE